MRVGHFLSCAAVCTGLLLDSSVTHAQAGNPSTPPARTGPKDAGDASVEVHFSSLDRDGDGLISRSEARANRVISNKFRQLDRDANGQLSPAEFSMQAAETGPVQPQDKVSGEAFARLDTNADGNLSRDEVRDNVRLSTRFTTIDANGDGLLSLPEYIASAEIHDEDGKHGARPPAGTRIAQAASPGARAPAVHPTRRDS